MIEKISVTNFKSHAQTEIELGRVTAIVGPNGCGKSSFLQAIAKLSEAALHPLREVFAGHYDPIFLVRSGQQKFDLSVDFGREGKLNLSVTRNAAPQNGDTNWVGSSQWDSQGTTCTTGYFHDVSLAEAQWDCSPPLSDNGRKHFLKGLKIISLANIFYLRSIVGYLAAPSYSEEVPPKMNEDGTGLASTIANLILTDRKRYEAIESALCSIVPTVLSVTARPAKVTRVEKKIFSVNNAQFPYDEPREVVGHELIFDTVGAKQVPAHATSDGTLLTLAILTTCWNRTSPGLILLDDIEYGLHPLAQRRLVQTLKELAASQQQQIILTSHSPYIVDELEAKDVWVMAADKEGISHCQQLSKGPNAEFALKVLTTGEFLGAEGEEWVLEQSLPKEAAHA